MKVELLPKSESQFFLQGVDVQVEFTRDDVGTVAWLVLHQNGQAILLLPAVP